MVEEKIESKGASAPFNMALASLQRVNDTLIEFKNLSSYGSAHGGQPISLIDRQLISVKLVKQIFLASAPLLKIEDVKVLQKKIKALNPKVICEIDNNKLATGRNIFTFSRELDLELDDLVLEISLALQKEGYFMPSKADPRYSWGQE